MIRSAKPTLLLATVACLLLPVLAPGESQVANDQRSERLVASAHVFFKIVIPQVLSMDLTDAEPHRISLSAAGHRSVAKLETCVALAAGSARSLNCTVSMP